MKVLIAAICLLGIFFSTASAYDFPIHPPFSLRQLYGEAELIVIAEVQKIEKLPKNSKLGNAQAHLTVTSTIKGQPVAESIAVYFDGSFPGEPFFSCPGSAHYEAGTKVLAFRHSVDQAASYVTCSSEGSKARSDEQLKVYQSRINDLKSILTMEDETLRT